MGCKVRVQGHWASGIPAVSSARFAVSRRRAMRVHEHASPDAAYQVEPNILATKAYLNQISVLKHPVAEGDGNSAATA